VSRPPRPCTDTRVAPFGQERLQDALEVARVRQHLDDQLPLVRLVRPEFLDCTLDVLARASLCLGPLIIGAAQTL
jgi:hypothetical protein